MSFNRIFNKIIFTQTRIGKDGKEFNILKIKTMIDSNNNTYLSTQENDSRIKNWAKWLRRWGIDEIPQIINIIKGEMTIIGPRPLTPQDFSILPKELIELRKKVKPGWFNPKYVSHNPFDFQTVVETEMDYIKSKLRKPFRTDIKYLFLIVFNIFFRGVRCR